MRRIPGRSQMLFPGLVFLALTLFCVPEGHVQSLRGRAYSALSPLLELTAAGRLRLQPRTASISIKLDSTETAAPRTDQDTGAEIDRLRAEQIRLLDQVNHLERAFPGQGMSLKEPPAVSAEVIARQVLWQEPLLGLNRGEADGVRLHAGVLHRGAAVGRIVAVGARASSMALLTHRGMCIAARLLNCRVEGVLQGAKDDGGERLCRMAVVCRELPAKAGEQVVTSGLDGAFPAGVWLGVVTEIKKVADVQWELTVRPANNENAIESVRVLTNAAPEVPWPAMPAGKRGGR